MPVAEKAMNRECRREHKPWHRIKHMGSLTVLICQRCGAQAVAP